MRLRRTSDRRIRARRSSRLGRVRVTRGAWGNGVGSTLGRGGVAGRPSCRRDGAGAAGPRHVGEVPRLAGRAGRRARHRGRGSHAAGRRLGRPPRPRLEPARAHAGHGNRGRRRPRRQRGHRRSQPAARPGRRSAGDGRRGHAAATALARGRRLADAAAAADRVRREHGDDRALREPGRARAAVPLRGVGRVGDGGRVRRHVRHHRRVLRLRA